jgi:transcriptional/translational regulatory protein YebC/TACO1
VRARSADRHAGSLVRARLRCLKSKHVEEVSPCMQKLVVMILHACLTVEPNRVSVLLSRAAERSGGKVSAGHSSVWLFKQCNQVVFSVPSAVRNRASVVLCADVQR